MAKSKKVHPDEAEDKKLFGKLIAKKLGGKSAKRGDKVNGIKAFGKGKAKKATKTARK